MNSDNELIIYMVRIVNTKDFLSPAENIKVRTIDAESAATMAVDIYEEITGEDIGEPILFRTEKFYKIFLTEKEYFLEIVDCNY